MLLRTYCGAFAADSVERIEEEEEDLVEGEVLAVAASCLAGIPDKPNSVPKIYVNVYTYTYIGK